MTDSCSDPMKTHKHRAKGEPKLRPYTHPIASAARPNPAAHGWACEIQTCRCGSTRQVNFNGRNLEVGAWEGGAK